MARQAMPGHRWLPRALLAGRSVRRRLRRPSPIAYGLRPRDHVSRLHTPVRPALPPNSIGPTSVQSHGCTPRGTRAGGPRGSRRHPGDGEDQRHRCATFRPTSYDGATFDASGRDRLPGRGSIGALARPAGVARRCGRPKVPGMNRFQPLGRSRTKNSNDGRAAGRHGRPGPSFGARPPLLPVPFLDAGRPRTATALAHIPRARGHAPVGPPVRAGHWITAGSSWPSG
jgi:hypothetical protein